MVAKWIGIPWTWLHTLRSAIYPWRPTDPAPKSQGPHQRPNPGWAQGSSWRRSSRSSQRIAICRSNGRLGMDHPFGRFAVDSGRRRGFARCWSSRWPLGRPLGGNQSCRGAAKCHRRAFCCRENSGSAGPKSSVQSRWKGSERARSWCKASVCDISTRHNAGHVPETLSHSSFCKRDGLFCRLCTAWPGK